MNLPPIIFRHAWQTPDIVESVSLPSESALKGKSRVEISRMAEDSAAAKLEEAKNKVKATKAAAKERAAKKAQDQKNKEKATKAAVKERAAKKAQDQKWAQQAKKQASVEKEERRQQDALKLFTFILCNPNRLQKFRTCFSNPC